MPSGNLKLYWLRLQNASTGELSYRFRQALISLYVKNRNTNLFQRIPILHPDDLEKITLPPLSSNVDRALIEQILDGATFYLNDDKRPCNSSNKASWAAFCNDTVTDESSFDIRFVWEPSRLQHLLILLLHYKHNQNEHTADFIRCRILKWIDSNPFPYGPHYVSALECGLRIPVFLHALKLLKNLDVEDIHCITKAVYIHAWWISHRLSLYSSLGNHTIAECAGLVFAGIVFNKTKQGKQWLKRGTALLTQEVNHQFHSDGGPTEQSINYHRFVLDLYWLVATILEKNSLHDCTSWKVRLNQGEEFQWAFTFAGRLPSIGDSDDGHAIAPGMHPRQPVILMKNEKMKSFPVSGYTILRPDDNFSLIFDHGPLGMPPLYNHGHADALSIILNKNGLEFLVDPGTFRYNGVPDYRKYFKGTRAHNTVTIDGQDQSIQETGFIWSHPYQTKVVRKEETENSFYIEALHTGYRRLKSPVTHRRAVIQSDDCFIIRDSFEGAGLHKYELHYHLHPEASAHDDGQWWQIKRNDSIIHIKMLHNDSFQYAHGQENPLLGWYSSAYGVRKKCGVLTCRKSGLAADVSFTTIIGLEVVPDLNKVNSLLGRLL